MTCSEIKNEFVKRLAPHYEKREALELFFIAASEILGKGKIELNQGAELKLAPSYTQSFLRFLQRLENNEPFQHILGKVDFYGLEFKVSPFTLIPRPETEELVNIFCNEVENPLSILDIGTGSGCIAISLSKKFSNSKVLAIDVSAEALVIAQENADTHEAKVEFKECNFLKKPPKQKFQYIISNPPYISESEIGDISEHVKGYEPYIALFVQDSNPLIFYDHIARYAEKYLMDDGAIYLEVNQLLGSETASVFDAHRWNVELRKDMSGNDRFLIVKPRTLPSD